MTNVDITLEQQRAHNRTQRNLFAQLFDIVKDFIKSVLAFFGFANRFVSGGRGGGQAAKEQAIKDEIAENAPDLDGIDNDLKHVSERVRNIRDKAARMLQIKLAKKYSRDLINEQTTGKEMAYPDHRLAPNMIKWVESLTLNELCELRDGDNRKIRDHIAGKRDMGILPFDQRNEKRGDAGQILRRQTEELLSRSSQDRPYRQELSHGDFRQDFLTNVSASHAPK